MKLHVCVWETTFRYCYIKYFQPLEPRVPQIHYETAFHRISPQNYFQESTRQTNKCVHGYMWVILGLKWQFDRSSRGGGLSFASVNYFEQLIYSPWMKVESTLRWKKGSVFPWLRCISPPAWKSSCGHVRAKSGAKTSNRELGADNCCTRFFDDERDSSMASTFHDGESAYMLWLT